MTTPKQAAPSRRSELMTHVGRRATRLQAAYLNEADPAHSTATAHLARLRRAAPEDPSDPSVWDVVFADLPESARGRGDDPTEAERAAYSSLTLFGVHMQGASNPKHVQGQRLGLAVGQLAHPIGEDPNDAVTRRFQAFATATTYPQRVNHLRNLISLLRSAERPLGLDYGQLAGDLYTVQFPGGINRIRLQWGRDFHTRPTKADNTDATSEKEN